MKINEINTIITMLDNNLISNRDEIKDMLRLIMVKYGIKEEYLNEDIIDAFDRERYSEKIIELFNNLIDNSDVIARNRFEPVSRTDIENEISRYKERFNNFLIERNAVYKFKNKEWI